jgi:hypothetical protein
VKIGQDEHLSIQYPRVHATFNVFFFLVAQAVVFVYKKPVLLSTFCPLYAVEMLHIADAHYADILMDVHKLSRHIFNSSVLRQLTMAQRRLVHVCGLFTRIAWATCRAKVGLSVKVG